MPNLVIVPRDGSDAGPLQDQSRWSPTSCGPAFTLTASTQTSTTCSTAAIAHIPSCWVEGVDDHTVSEGSLGVSASVHPCEDIERSQNASAGSHHPAPAPFALLDATPDHSECPGNDNSFIAMVEFKL